MRRVESSADFKSEKAAAEGRKGELPRTWKQRRPTSASGASEWRLM
jgi:hypothetical protein